MSQELGQFDIVLARVEFANCNDLRPCLIVYPPKSGRVEIAAISSQFTLFDENAHFCIENYHSDFRDTGLTRRSYIVADTTYFLEVADIKKRIGRLEGSLADEFKEWYGM